MLYGANGYTGELIAAHAVARGMHPVLAGRSEAPVRALATRLGLEYAVFPLENGAQIAAHLEGFAGVLLAAGPFSATSRPMVEACLAARAHYLDITGEIEVFEACHRADARARDRGIVILPGAGFDVVPSDCLAASLAARLPDATHLELAFAGLGESSRGTTKTVIANLPRGGAIRRNGRIERVPINYRSATIPFRDKPRTAVTIPWGDVSTAFHSTGIGNIEVYMAMSRSLVRATPVLRALAPVMGLGPVQRLATRIVERRMTGPDEAARRRGSSQLWGRVTDATGRSVEGTLVTPEGYHLTMLTAVESMRRVLAGNVAAGFQTPSRAFGAEYIATFEGCDLRVTG